MIGYAAHFTSTAPSGAGKDSFAPIGGREGQRADALHDHAGVAMGSVPLQVGTGVKQEQNQPWAKSQQNGDGWQAGARTAVGREPIFWDGWQEQGQPWAECQFVGTEGKQGQGNRGISA